MLFQRTQFGPRTNSSIAERKPCLVFFVHRAKQVIFATALCFILELLSE
jgi:hypothetical protein